MKEKQNILLLQIIFILFIFLSLALASQDQEIIENPEEPLNKNAGRVIQLKEVMRITDEGTNYYFKEPRNIKIAEDGSIFILDGVDKLYKFDAKGNFINNLITKGEGPGEVNELMSFFLEGKEIILYDGMGNKIVKLDKQGNLIQELKLGEKRFYTMIAYYTDNYYMVDSKRMNFERKTEIKEVGRNLYIVNNKGEIKGTPHDFVVKDFYRFRPRSVSSFPVSRLQIAIENGRFLYLSHTIDYIVKLLDLENVQIIRSFSREYDSVKADHSTEYRKLLPKHHNDIQKLLVYKNYLWVLTSIIQEDRGILIDVFDKEGKYLDSIYLPLHETKPKPIIRPRSSGYPPMAINDNHMYAILWDEGHNIFIVKYEIIM